MKKGRGKQKGNRYEIKISGLLSKWYKDDGKDYFWRTAGSGARATVLKKNESPFVGDITFLINPDGLIPIIECKDRKEITFDNVSTKKFKPFQYWDEVKTNCRKLNIEKPVWVIFKIHNFADDFLCIEQGDFETFTCNEFKGLATIMYDFDYIVSSQHFIIVKLEEFLEYIKNWQDKVIEKI